MSSRADLALVRGAEVGSGPVPTRIALQWGEGTYQAERARLARSAACRSLSILEAARRALAARLHARLVIERSCAAVGRGGAAHRTERALAADVAVFPGRHDDAEPLGRSARTRQRRRGALGTVVPIDAAETGSRSLHVLVRARGVVWRGVVWRGVVWCGVVSCGVVWWCFEWRGLI